MVRKQLVRKLRRKVTKEWKVTLLPGCSGRVDLRNGFWSWRRSDVYQLAQFHVRGSGVWSSSGCSLGLYVGKQYDPYNIVATTVQLMINTTENHGNSQLLIVERVGCSYLRNTLDERHFVSIADADEISYWTHRLTALSRRVEIGRVGRSDFCVIAVVVVKRPARRTVSCFCHML